MRGRTLPRIEVARAQGRRSRGRHRGAGSGRDLPATRRSAQGQFVNLPPDAIAHIRQDFVDEVSYMRTALENVKARDPKHAEALYREALAKNPDNAEAYAFLGGLLTDRGELAKGRWARSQEREGPQQHRRGAAANRARSRGGGRDARRGRRRPRRRGSPPRFRQRPLAARAPGRGRAPVAGGRPLGESCGTDRPRSRVPAPPAPGAR